MQGVKEIKDCISDFIAKFGEGYMDATNDLMPPVTVKTDFNKIFYFDACQNDRGTFVRISEVKSTFLRMHSSCCQEDSKTV